MINLELRKYIECSREEKLPLLKMISEIVLLANLARMEGVLALEKRLKMIDDRLLSMGLELVVDGTDPRIVEEIMDMVIVASFKTGAELLSQLIIRDGVLGIQCGHNPRIIELRLKALLGDELLKQGCGIRQNEKDLMDVYEPLMADLESWEAAKGLPEFEQLVNRSHRDIQSILMQVDINELVVALTGASLGLKRHFLRNLSKNLCVQVICDMKRAGPMTQGYITRAQQSILNVLHSLKESGEILL